MSRMNKSLKFGIALTMLTATLSMTACGKRLGTSATTQATLAPQQTSDQVPVTTPTYDYDNQNSNIEAVASAAPNTQSGSLKVDKALFSSWQAKGIAVGNGTIYITVSDMKGLLQYGSVVKMGTDGNNWKNIGTALLGLSHPVGKTVQGIAISGSTLIAADTNGKMYTLDAANGKVKTTKNSGGTDVAVAGGSVYVANGSVSKTDTSLSSLTPVTGLNATGGIGGDSKGNVYAVSGSTIKKYDPTSGQVQDLVTTNLAGPIDVAADNRNGDIYVLEGTMIKRFNANGQMLSSFSSGAIKGVAIAIDESGALYVADSGNSNKDSQVIKFAAAPLTSTASSSSVSGYNYGY